MEMNKSQSQILLPFSVVALAWLILGSFVSVFFSKEPLGTSVGSFLLVFTLCLANLFFLFKATEKFLLILRSTDLRVSYTIQLIFWSALKLAGLGAIVFLLMKSSGLPRSSLISGMAVLFILPVVGGYSWAMRDLRSRPKGAKLYAS